MNLTNWKKRVDLLREELPQWKKAYPEISVGVLRATAVLWPYFQAAGDGDRDATKAFYQLVGKHNLKGLEHLESEWEEKIDDLKILIRAIDEATTRKPEICNELQLLVEQFGLVNRKDTSSTAHINITVGKSNDNSKVTGLEINNYYTNELDHRKLREARRKYLEGLREKCQELPLASLGLNNDPNKIIDLDQIYIPLNTTKNVRPDGSPLKEQIDKAKIDISARPLTIHEAGERNRYVVILGYPGAGKSTFLKSYISKLSSRHLEEDGEYEDQDVVAKESVPLPLMLSLRLWASRLSNVDLPSNWQERSQKYRETFLKCAKDAHKDCLGDFVEHFEEAVRSGNCILALDGLDEVASTDRELIKEAILSLSKGGKPPEKILVTCRVRSYEGRQKLDGYTEFTLAKLNEDQIKRFSEKWYKALIRSDAGTDDPASERATQKANEMIKAINTSSLSLIAENPMLLTMLAIVHEQDNKLPEKRVVLFDRAIDILLSHWEMSRVQLDTLVGEKLAEFINDKEKVRPLLQNFAYKALDSAKESSDEATGSEISRADALFTLEKLLGSLDLSQAFLSYINKRAGLFQDIGSNLGQPSSYSFVHRSFQEYLAGCELIECHDLELLNRLRTFSEEGDYWTSVIQLCGEELFFNRSEEDRLLNIASELCPKKVDSPDSAKQLIWSGYFTNLYEPEAIYNNDGVIKGGGEAFLTRLKGKMVDAIQAPEKPISMTELAELGRMLANLGDPRLGVTSLPHMRFCYVDSGPFYSGEDISLINVSYGYWISEYPISNAQFSAFVDTGGYEDRSVWSKIGWKLKNKNKWKAPKPFTFPFALPNHPVVGISWYEADAFAHWMQRNLKEKQVLEKGWVCRLPNDPEWEKAARGGIKIPAAPCICQIEELDRLKLIDRVNNPAPFRTFAWDGNTVDAQLMNFDEAGIDSTVALGSFNAGRSVYGVQEMNGQVWEWLRSFYEIDYVDLPVSEWDSHEERESQDFRVWRGGAFSFSANHCENYLRSYYRAPDSRDNFLGFRIVIRPKALDR